MQKTSPDQVERVARLYRHNAEAAAALGITPRSFVRVCRKLGVETPYVRAKRRRSDASAARRRPVTI
jgi:hypothetical protein